MKKLSLLFLILVMMSGCTEITEFGLASINLFFELLKIGGILLLILVVIGIIISIFNN